MTRVKVCGVTSAHDAAEIASIGVHAMGVILVPETPRYVGDKPQVLEAIRRAAGPFVCLVAVVRSLGEAENLPAGVFSAVQYYEESREAKVPAGLKRIRALRVGVGATVHAVAADDDAVVLDAYDPHRLGGTGRRFEWRDAGALDLGGKPVIVAGGLTPTNVGQAICALRPYAVDVSSGVETAPGRKDMTMVRAFLGAVRDADAAMDCDGGLDR